MQIRIEGRHMKVTEAIREHVNKKTSHLDKYFDGITGIHVILSVEDTRQKSQISEIVCAVVRGQPLVATAAHADMYMAVDESVHKMREHLKKFKSKMRSRKRESARFASPKAGLGNPNVEVLEEEEGL